MIGVFNCHINKITIKIRNIWLLGAVSNLEFWFKFKAGLSFPAVRDFPPDQIFAVGRKPQAYF